jgi:hypothetical protein
MSVKGTRRIAARPSIADVTFPLCRGAQLAPVAVELPRHVLGDRVFVGAQQFAHLKRSDVVRTHQSLRGSRGDPERIRHFFGTKKAATALMFQFFITLAMWFQYAEPN